VRMTFIGECTRFENYTGEARGGYHDE